MDGLPYTSLADTKTPMPVQFIRGVVKVHADTGVCDYNIFRSPI